MDINIIDRQFNYLGQIDAYESLILNKKWHGIGNAELHLHEDTLHSETLQKENIIYTSNNKAYIILFREFDSITGKLVIKGRELKSYLSRWIIYPPEGMAYYRINSNTETIMKEYVQATLNRKGIAHIVVAENQGRGNQTVYQTRYKNLAEELEKLSLSSNLGWDITLDPYTKKFVFDCYEGLDRTSEQDTNPNAIFSIDYDNIAEQKLIDSKLDYANTAIVAGQGEGEYRIIETVGDTDKGLDSYEIFVDARDIEYDEDLPVRGLQKLSELPEILTFDSSVDTTKNLRYEEDFNLGDIATVQNSKWGVVADRRITEVTEVYESTGFRLDVAFGEGLATIGDKIKQIIDTPISEGGSGNIVPSGLISMWSGLLTTIPEGWALCDGDNGTPDLQDRFIVGAGNSYEVGDIGGEDTVVLSTTNLPSHNHYSGTLVTSESGEHSHSGSTASAGSHSHTEGTLEIGSVDTHTHGSGTYSAGSAGSHTHGSGTISTNSTGAHRHTFNATTRTVYPDGGAHYSAFYRSSSESTSSAGSHSHTISGNTASGGSHSHGVTGTSSAGGSHTHSISGRTSSTGSHSHSVTITSGGSHSHGVSGSTSSTGNGLAHENRPPYFALAFIMKL